MLRSMALGAGTVLLTLSALASAPQDPVLIDKSRVPAAADSIGKFAPAGWKIEEQSTGDLNGDGLPDYALKLVEDKPAKDQDDVATERSRALVIVLAGRTPGLPGPALPTGYCSVLVVAEPSMESLSRRPM